jgi:membrane protease subunit HflK
MAESEVERGAGRTIGVGLTVLVVLGVLGAWGAMPGSGWYRLEPGEAAVVLRLGRHVRTVRQEGIGLKWPTPIETVDIVNVGVSQRIEFGAVDAQEGPKLAETAMQTADNNIVLVEFVVQYRIGDPFKSLYRVADLPDVLGDAAQAAMREIVGRNTIDHVLTERRGAVQADAAELLEKILADYEAGVSVEAVELQEVQPPGQVRESFDDVIAANQDRNRKVNEAEGYANEILPRSRAQAGEVEAEAAAYKEEVIAVAHGEADRFLALVMEYEKAPAITRKRLYLETMEAVLPKVEKILIEPGTQVLPYLPLGQDRRSAAESAPSAVPAAPADEGS